MDQFFKSVVELLNLRKNFIIASCFISCNLVFGQATWTLVAASAPDNSGGLMLLLSDGSVLCKTTAGGSDGVGSNWNKLTPNINGSYLSGTWSSVAPMADTRLYFSAQTMKDARIYIAGGEYGTGGSSGEIYDPVTNSWSIAPTSGGYLGDANSAILNNGKIMQATLVNSFNQTLIFDPFTNSYSNGPNTIGGHDEATWIKLKDNSILFVDIGSTSSERYIPALNQWIADANVPVNLYDNFGSETGPGFLLPDGRAFFLGSTGNTAIYTPSGNNSPGSWVAGPNVPGGNGCPDAAGAMKVDGKIIFSAAPAPIGTNSVFLTPTSFYEYDYLSNTITPVSAPGGGPSLNISCFETAMLDLPDGTVMLSVQGSKSYFIHKPSGAALAAGQPTISSVTQNGCSNTFTLTGMLFNGICQGACYGDDWQMDSNYPIVSLTSGSNVYYARTFNWNRTGVQTGALPDTTLFTLPPNIPNGTYSLSVSANGNSSIPVTFTFSPFPALISSLTPSTICSGNSFSYNPVATMTNTTMMWTRAAVGGISNAAITTPQAANPNESLINTSNISKTVVYSYTLTNGSCVTFYQVSVVVNPNQSLSVTGNYTLCQNEQDILIASGLPTYSWSTSAFTNSIAVSPPSTTVYTVSGTNSFGCFCLKQVTVIVNPVPALNISGTPSICVGDSTILTANGNGSSYYWSTSQTSHSITVSPGVTTTYFVNSYFLNGCQSSDSITILVQACTGVKENTRNGFNAWLYPNPFNNQITMECIAKEPGIYAIKIIDIFGRVVKEEEYDFVIGNNKKEVLFDALSSGVYMFTMQKDFQLFKSKVIKN